MRKARWEGENKVGRLWHDSRQRGLVCTPWDRKKARVSTVTKEVQDRK
jgi:hypothetical protein